MTDDRHERSTNMPGDRSDPTTTRRPFLARGAALASVPAIATLVPGALTDPAFADDSLPDYAPIPPSALGPALNAQGYFVGRVERNLYWVTDAAYQAAFLTTKDGVVLFDAPPSIGHNLQRAIDQIASDNGVSNQVTHIVYSHHHADHVGASSLFGGDVVRVGHNEAKRLLARDNDPTREPHLQDPPQAGRRRGEGRPGVARHQPHTRQHLHPLPGPRHPHAGRRQPAWVGAVQQPQPGRGRPGLPRRSRQGVGIPVEALHRRPHGPPGHPQRHGRLQESTSATWSTVSRRL